MSSNYKELLSPHALNCLNFHSAICWLRNSVHCGVRTRSIFWIGWRFRPWHVFIWSAPRTQDIFIRYASIWKNLLLRKAFAKFWSSGIRKRDNLFKTFLELSILFLAGHHMPCIHQQNQHITRIMDLALSTFAQNNYISSFIVRLIHAV